MSMEEIGDLPVQVHCVCKLKHDIRVESKIDLAKREIEQSLGTPVETIVTLPGLFRKLPFSLLDEKIIDRMTRLLYLGKAHGFRTELRNLSRLVKLCRKATYLREIYAVGVMHRDQIANIAARLGLSGPHEQNMVETDCYVRILPNAQIFNQALGSNEFLTTILLVPAQTLLEYAAEVVKLPYVTFTKQYRNLDERLGRMEAGVKEGIADLLDHLASSPKRMPWLGIYKENIGDYVDWAFSDFRTWGLHFIHKHEGKADPWLARSVLNLSGIDEGNRVLDPFCGSGTFIADAPLLNINAIGIDVNPLSTMIAKVKCNLPNIALDELKESLIRINKESSNHSNSKERLKSLMLELEEKDKGKLSNNGAAIMEILWIKNAIDEVTDHGLTRDFLYTMLSRSIIEVTEKQKRRFDGKESFMKDAIDFYLQALASQEILRILNIEAKGVCSLFTADAHSVQSLLDGKVDGIVTSPPYFDALDYVGFSRLPMRILELDLNGKRLELGTIGSKSRIASDADMWSLCDLLPDSGRLLLDQLLKAGRERKARVVLQYLLDMSDCLQMFFNVLKENGRIIFVVGRYHNWKIGDNNVLFDGAQVLTEIGESVGLCLEDRLSHNISKIEAGQRIKEESIVIWRK
jgi:site-specific DNA-methyltransferase (cytosine-N4-specific)